MREKATLCQIEVGRMCEISVIIPYYNNQDTILRALESVKAQSLNNYELILVDDGSNDRSNDIVNCFAVQNPEMDITILHQENMGPSAARNCAIKVSKGAYIAFLDSDDEWVADKLKTQYECMKNNQLDMLACGYYIIKDGKRSEFSFTKKKLKKTGFKELLFKHYYATPCVMVKKSVLEDAGLFPEQQRYMEDAFLFTSIARRHKAFVTNEHLVNIYKMPYGERGLSSKLVEMEKYELRNLIRFFNENDRHKQKLDVFTLAAAGIFSVLKYLRRKILVFIRNSQ